MAILLQHDPDRRCDTTRRPCVLPLLPAQREEACLVALHLPRTDVGAVRRSLRHHLSLADASLARVRDAQSGTWRRMSPGEATMWGDAVVESAPGTPDTIDGVRAALSSPLGSAPCRVIVGEHTVVLRWHRAVALRRQAQHLLETLVDQSPVSA